VLIDLGCKYKGYCCDVTRMYNVEKNPKIYYFYNLLKELQKKLISLCKPGVKVKDIDLYARKFVEQLGLKDKYLHSTGHGIGIEIHEPPRLSQFDETVLKENMVITIEPGIYFENEFGLRIEDDVLVIKDGCKVLTYMLN
jgi:Xaa-Pro aminopeptidase